MGDESQEATATKAEEELPVSENDQDAKRVANNKKEEKRSKEKVTTKKFKHIHQFTFLYILLNNFEISGLSLIILAVLL